MNGPYFEWYSNGKNKKQGHYLDEKQIILKEWNENGEEVYWKDGKREGLWKRYYENGQLSSEVNFKDGKRAGLWKEYDENGQLNEEVNFKYGKREGYGN